MMCRSGALLCVALLLLLSAAPADTKKGRRSKQRQALRNAKEQQSGRFDHLDASWTSFSPLKGDSARLASRYSLGTSEPDALPMTVEPALMTRWEDARVPSKAPDAARGSADPLNIQSARKQGSRMQALNGDWMFTEHLPTEAEVETLIDDPTTGTRIATISQFANASEVSRLIELMDIAPTLSEKRLSVDQRRIRGYRYTYIGAGEDEVVATLEDRMAAVSGLPTNPRESRLMLSEYLSLPQSHPYFPLNNIHLDVDVKPDRVATFIIYLSDVEVGGETLFPLLHSIDATSAFSDRQPPDLRQVSAFLDASGRVTSVQSKQSSHARLRHGSVSYTSHGEEAAAAGSSCSNGNDATAVPLREVFRNLTADRLSRAITMKDKRWEKDMYRVVDRGSPAVHQDVYRPRDSEAELAWQAANRMCEAQLQQDDAKRQDMLGGAGDVLAIRPKAGTALLFFSRTRENLLDALTWHGACTVVSGTKFTAQKFKGWAQ